QADYGFFFPGMIEEDAIACLHLAQVVPRLIVSNASPICSAIANKICPGVSLRFLLDHPKVASRCLFHRLSLIDCCWVGDTGLRCALSIFQSQECVFNDRSNEQCPKKEVSRPTSPPKTKTARPFGLKI